MSSMISKFQHARSAWLEGLSRDELVRLEMTSLCSAYFCFVVFVCSAIGAICLFLGALAVHSSLLAPAIATSMIAVGSFVAGFGLMVLMKQCIDQACQLSLARR